MNSKIILCWGVMMFIVKLSFAQNKDLSIEDAVLKQRSSLAPTRLNQMQWMNKSNAFTFITTKAGKDVMVKVSVPALTFDTLLSVDVIAKSYYEATGDSKKPEKFPTYNWVDETHIRFQHNNTFLLYDFAKKESKILLQTLPEMENLDYEPISNQLAYTYGNNLYISNANTYKKTMATQPPGKDPLPSNEEKITIDAADGIVYGTAVHRNEFGINKGTFWSPKGNKLAFYRMDERQVTKYGIMHFDSKPSSTEFIHYPMAGATTHYVKVVIYDVTRKGTIFVQAPGPEDQYLTNISWSPDEEYLYIAHVNRAQNEMKLNMYDAKTGVFIKTLFTETHDKYVEPEKPLYFLNDNVKQFVWMSERDGYNQLYLYNRSGEVVKQLTTDKMPVTEFLGFQADNKFAYYLASANDGLDKLMYSVELKTGKTKLITRTSGTHTITLQNNGNYLIDMFSSTTIPRRVSVLDVNGAEYGSILNAVNPIADYKNCNITLVKIPSADAKYSLNGRLILPANYDANKKYPVIVYVYGGPHVQLVSNSWLAGADMWLYFMAQRGFIVFTLDSRGSLNRGLEFENATFRKLGTEEIADQLEGVKFLKKMPSVDSTRMGVYGWSFGGFMSTSLMTRTPGVFKVGVAGGPVIDWRLYEIMYTERYMDMPSENPKGYETADLTNYVSNLQGHLLLIHGTSDPTVVWQHTLTYLKKCVDNGVLVDYFVYPGHEHNVLGKDRVHLMKKITRYFNDYL